jgi:DNA-directed RNA polymerase subunit omega
MDPHVVFDGQKVLPNRFALSLAAAARKRALNHGAERRLAGWPDAGTGDLALHEIAAAAFTEAELSTALRGPRATALLRERGSPTSLPASPDGAAAPRLQPKETIH